VVRDQVMRQDLPQVAASELGLIDPISQLGEIGIRRNLDLEPVAGLLERPLGFIYGLLLQQKRIESSPVSASINGDDQTQELRAWDDWSHLTFNGGNIGSSVIKLPPILPTY
jgi:hypothetical protein